MSVTSNIKNIRANIDLKAKSVGRDLGEISILAATKMVEIAKINQLPLCGITLAGENRVQEFLQKYADSALTKDITWHFIGVLQTNKVKQIVDKVDMIHSVDRVALVDEIEKQAGKIGKVMNVLIEINAENEDSKSGVAVKDLPNLYKYVKAQSHLKLKGFMPVLPIDAPEKLYAEMFEIYEKYRAIDPEISVLSMGMSDDYETAIKHGATIVRLGSCLFGQRNY